MRTEEVGNYVLVLLVIGTIGGESADSCSSGKQPNIIFMLCDDVGFDDIGLHGNNQIPTPNIDSLLTHGVNFRRYYSAPMCTPARSSLMTGKYASKLGMQHYVIPNDQPYGLGLEHKLLPQYLQELGYSTHAIGKWHLGFFREKYTATYRGFDSFFGYQGGMIDYFNHTSDSIGNGLAFLKGYDMRRNTTLAWDTQGQYATDLFTDFAVDTILNHDQEQPLFLYMAHLAAHAGNEELVQQAHEEDIQKFAYIQDPLRRAYAAVMSKMDDSVGRVLNALQLCNMLENSVVVFVADNGSPVVGELHNAGSNFPFRGQKDSPWEGASHVAGGIWAPFLQHPSRISNELIHITDWLPTLVHVAGGQIDDPTIDGINQWPSLCRNTPGPRTEILVNIDQAEPSPYRAYIFQDWKLVKGTSHNGTYDGWLCDNININQETHPSFNCYGQSLLDSDVSQAIRQCISPAKQSRLTVERLERLREKSIYTCNNAPFNVCDPRQNSCLFNIVADPCERNDLSQERPDIVALLQQRLDFYEPFALKPRNKPDDARSNPLYFNATWVWWYDELNVTSCGKWLGGLDVIELI